MELSSQIESQPVDPHSETDVKAVQYRRFLEQRTRNIQFGALHDRVDINIELNEIYIPERGVYSYLEQLSENSTEKTLLRRELFLMDIVETAQKHGRQGVVLLGPAGSGKTTTLRQLTGCVLRKDARISKTLCSYLPMLLPLRFVVPKRASLAMSLGSYYKGEGLGGIPEEYFRKKLRDGGCLVMLDGLDEVPDRNGRKRTVEWLAQARQEYPKNFFVITSRDHVYRDFHAYFDANFLRVDIQALSPTDILNFIRVWYEVIMQRQQMQELFVDAQREADRLSEEIARREELLRLAANPLMLQIMTMVNLFRGTLPQTRADLYRECVLLLAYTWDEMRGVGALGAINKQDILQILELVATWLHREEGRTQDSKKILDVILKDPEEQEKGLIAEAPIVMERMLERGALIYETEDENIRFKHHAFQEYLVARRLLAEKDYAFLVQRLTSPWWREVIFLFLGHQAPSTFSQFMRKLVQSGIFEKERELVLECIRAAEGANRPPNVFVDLLLNSTASFEARYNALLALREVGLGANRDRIETALKNDSSRIGEFARLFLGIEQSPLTETTSLPARWQNPTDQMQYVLVPAGQFDMGARDSEALPQETPADFVYLDAYYIAVHPVTNLQYQKFIQATGHITPSGNDWWNSWIGDKYPPGMDHHPVVFVSWYDAMRYCEWARCMLPTEAQWEKAARGPDGRRFPWGDTSKRADELMNFDSNIGRTTEVGLYPDGASPYGCLDMSGNVWEWCADWFSANYWRQERRNPEGPRLGTRRIDRGGGWQMDARRCRAAYRGHWPPNYPDRDLGFRTTVLVDRVLGKIS